MPDFLFMLKVFVWGLMCLILFPVLVVGFVYKLVSLTFLIGADCGDDLLKWINKG